MKYAVVLALFALLAVASAAIPTITDLVSGTATSGSLTAQPSEEAAEFDIKYYRFWVPENVQTLEFDFAQTAASTCASLAAYIYSSHVPCGNEWSAGFDVNYPCQDAGDFAYFTTSGDTIDVFPTYSEGVNLARPGSYIYISVWRYFPFSDSDKQCDFTITPTLVACPANQVADYSDGTCIADGTPVTLPYTASLTGDVATYTYKFEVPSRTAHVRVWANTTEYIYMYGTEGLPTTSSSYAYCYQSSTSDPDSANYLIDEYCYIPTSGTFYILLEASTGFVVGDVMITIQTCDEMMGGWNCTYPSWNLTGVTPPSGASYGIDYEAGTGAISGYSGLYFFLSAANGTEAYYNITTTLTAGSASVAYRRNGYSDYYAGSYYYSAYESLTIDAAEVFALTWHNTYVGGDHFVGVFNTGVVATNFTVSAAAASGSSSSGDSTTAAGTTGSSATSVVASFALIAALLALLF